MLDLPFNAGLNYAIDHGNVLTCRRQLETAKSRALHAVQKVADAETALVKAEAKLAKHEAEHLARLAAFNKATAGQR